MRKTETDKMENVPNAPMLRDDELDFVSGGLTLNLENCMVSSFTSAVILADQNYKG